MPILNYMEEGFADAIDEFYDQIAPDAPEEEIED